jgi:hypothetical protein
VRLASRHRLRTLAPERKYRRAIIARAIIGPMLATPSSPSAVDLQSCDFTRLRHVEDDGEEIRRLPSISAAAVAGGGGRSGHTSGPAATSSDLLYLDRRRGAAARNGGDDGARGILINPQYYFNGRGASEGVTVRLGEICA